MELVRLQLGIFWMGIIKHLKLKSLPSRVSTARGPHGNSVVAPRGKLELKAEDKVAIFILCIKGAPLALFAHDCPIDDLIVSNCSLPVSQVLTVKQ